MCQEASGRLGGGQTSSSASPSSSSPSSSYITIYHPHHRHHHHQIIKLILAISKKHRYIASLPIGTGIPTQRVDRISRRCLRAASPWACLQSRGAASSRGHPWPVAGAGIRSSGPPACGHCGPCPRRPSQEGLREPWGSQASAPGSRPPRRPTHPRRRGPWSPPPLARPAGFGGSQSGSRRPLLSEASSAADYGYEGATKQQHQGSCFLKDDQSAAEQTMSGRTSRSSCLLPH